MYHIFFFHSSIDGHRLFSHRTIVNNVAYEHRGTDIFLSQCFHFSLMNTQKWIFQIIWKSYFRFFLLFFGKKFELLYKVTVIYYTNGWFPSNHMETNFHMVAPIYIPPTVHKCSLFSMCSHQLFLVIFLIAIQTGLR